MGGGWQVASGCPMEPDTQLKVEVNYFLSIKYEIKLEFVKLALGRKIAEELVKLNGRESGEL